MTTINDAFLISTFMIPTPPLGGEARRGGNRRVLTPSPLAGERSL